MSPQKEIYQTPGIFFRAVEHQKVLPRLTSVTGFVGLAERGPLNSPQKLTSWGQYQDVFGRIQDGCFLGPAVYGFFSNGGVICYVTRVADTQTEEKKAAAAFYRVYNQEGKEVIQIDAINEGKWGNHITMAIKPTTKNMVLSRLVKPAGRGVSSIYVGSAIDFQPEMNFILVRPGDLSVRAEKKVEKIDLTAKRLHLNKPLEKDFPTGSLILGSGFNLTVEYEQMRETFENLSLNPEHERFLEEVINGDADEPSYIKRASEGYSILIQVKLLKKEGPIKPFLAPDPDKPHTPVKKQTDGENPKTPLNYRYFTGYENGSYFPHTEPSDSGYQGLAAFELVEEIDLIAIPDLGKSEVGRDEDNNLSSLKLAQQQMLHHCEKMGSRFAILDAPQPRIAKVARATELWTSWAEDLAYGPGAQYGAIYAPWIKGSPIENGRPKGFIPPCGYIAGIYARTDSEYGVHKSPANEVMRDVYQLEYAIDDEIQGLLNPAGVNCIRSFPGRGIRVWGARTVSRDVRWRYITVRRLALLVIKEIQRKLQWTVFEPNAPTLWPRITSTLTSFLNGLFQRGMLAGSSPDQAFYVKCDGETNPPESVLRGEVMTELGFAPVYPAEFIVLIIMRTPGSLALTEKF